MSIEDGLKARRNQQTLSKLAGERGGSGDFAQRQKDAITLATAIAKLRKDADALNSGIEAAQQRLDDIVSDLETSLPPVAQAVIDLSDALSGGTAGQIYRKGSSILGGEWADVIGPIGDGHIIEEGAGFIRFSGGFTIAYSPVIIAYGVSSGAGDIFESATLTWNFGGLTFDAPPIVSAGAASDGRVWIAPFDATTSGCSARAKSHVSIAGDVSFTLRAEGFT